MTDRSSRRRLVRPVLVLLLVAVMAACGTTSSTSAPSGPAGPSTPAVRAYDDLVADLAGVDGTTVTTNAFLLITDDGARLCGIVMESYPPQCGGQTIHLLGEVPADVFDALDRTDDPTLAQARWGYVEVTGLLDAAGSDGAPTLTVESIRIAQP